MTRLLNSINEAKLVQKPVKRVIDKAIRSIRSQCKPWLNEVKFCKKEEHSPGRIAWRGIEGAREMPVLLNKSVRKDRKPLDTPESYHMLWNNLFQEHWGWRARSEALFITGAYGRSAMYGTGSFMVFPIGKFQFLWSPKIYDLMGITGNFEQVIKNDYKNKELCYALSTGNEIMVKCNAYHAINEVFIMDYINEVLFGGEQVYMNYRASDILPAANHLLNYILTGNK